MRAKKEVMPCKECGKEFKRAELSNKGLCYDCGKKRMLEIFEAWWARKLRR